MSFWNKDPEQINKQRQHHKNENRYTFELACPCKHELIYAMLSTRKVHSNPTKGPVNTWSIAQGIKQRRFSLPEKRCGKELGNDGTACTTTHESYCINWLIFKNIHGKALKNILKLRQRYRIKDQVEKDKKSLRQHILGMSNFISSFYYKLCLNLYIMIYKINEQIMTELFLKLTTTMLTVPVWVES